MDSGTGCFLHALRPLFVLSCPDAARNWLCFAGNIYSCSRPLEDIVPVLAHSMCMDTLSLYHKKFLYTKAELKKLVEEQACFETLVQDARLD